MPILDFEPSAEAACRVSSARRRRERDDQELMVDRTESRHLPSPATLVFDIETGPLPDSLLHAIMPPFDPDEVKCGDMKDPIKIAEKIAKCERKHREKLISLAALSAETGRVLAIGFGNSVNGVTVIHGKEESAMLKEFWQTLDHYNNFAGWNIRGFDMPFLIRRSWLLGVSGWERAFQLGAFTSSRPQISCQFVDLMQVYGLGEYGYMAGLDRVAKAFGLPGKTGSGKDFARLYSDPATQADAIAYLRRDMELTMQVGRRIAPALFA